MMLGKIQKQEGNASVKFLSITKVLLYTYCGNYVKS